MLIGLDIETYGECRATQEGYALPEQRLFHPERMLHNDRPVQLNLTAAVTTVEHTPSTLNAQTLSQLKPATSTPFLFPQHTPALSQWAQRATILCGANIAYDLLCLRTDPQLRPHLHPGSHILIDSQVCTYLENEMRPERALKPIGPIYNTHNYNGHVHGNFPTPTEPDSSGRTCLEYNCEDTHNTILVIAEAARRISSRTTAKLSPYCIQYYSDLIWSTVLMSESGIYFNTPALLLDYYSTITSVNALERFLRHHNLLLSGKGSEKSKYLFAEYCCSYIDGDPLPSLRHTLTPSHKPLTQLISERIPPAGGNQDASEGREPMRQDPLLSLTEKKKLIAFDDQNRNLFLDRLPSNDPIHHVLSLCNKWTRSSKLISNHYAKLLGRTREWLASKSKDRQPKNVIKAQLIPPSSPELPGHDQFASALTPIETHPIAPWVAYPTWHIIPSAFEEDGEGGQKQCRLSGRNPGILTLPKQIKKHITSRYGPSGTLRFYDQSQIELRVAALVSGEPTLISNYINDGDLHTTRAISIYNDVHGPNYLHELCNGDISKHNPAFDAPRQLGKKTNFADLYWSSAATMRAALMDEEGIDLPLSFFETIVSTRQRTRPQLHAWQSQLIEDTQRSGILEIPFIGVSRYFSDDPANRSQIINFPVQAIAAALTIRIQHYVTSRLPPQIHLLYNHYDALIFDLPKKLQLQLDDILHSATLWLQTQDLWHMLQGHYQRHVPLKLEGETL